MKSERLMLRIAASLVFLAALPSVAMAYIDPGNGAYMVQALFTAIGAAIFYLRHPIDFAKALWHRVTKRRERAEDGLEGTVLARNEEMDA